MKIKLFLILLLVFVNMGLIIGSNDFNMNQIIEIDNFLSKGKAKNTSNPNVKGVEQNNPIYLHYIKDCGITDIDDKDSGIQKARYEFYTHNDFKKNKNTLLFIPIVERDFPVYFNCTEEILTIKSISPSRFNEIKSVLEEISPNIINDSNKSTANDSISITDETIPTNETKVEGEEDGKKTEKIFDGWLFFLLRGYYMKQL